MADQSPIGLSLDLRDFVRAWHWAWGLILPAPRFLDIGQGIDYQSHPNLSWLHANIRIRRGAAWWLRKIEGCRVFLIRRSWGPNPPGDGIVMHWRSAGSSIPPAEVDIYFGETYSVPVAWRDEAANGLAYLTNQNWMLSGGQDRKHPLSPGRYEFWLEVRGWRRWRSEQVFVLQVPPQGIGNAFFTLEAKYL